MLEELILDNNNLNFTSITIFNTLENLASLSLKNALYSPEAVNSLRHSLVKSNLPKLKYLWLDSNQLVLLPVRLFYVNKGAVNSQRLEVISLKNNSIGTIEYGTFNSSVLKHLKTIDLRDNGLYTLDKTVLSEFDKFPNLTIKLFPNTFRCNCDLRYFHAWMQSTNVTLPGKEKLVCAEGYYPYENANQNIMSLDAADFKCQHAIAVEHYLEPSYVILGIILSFLIACILGVVFLRRKQIKVGLRNVFLAARESIESGPYGERRGYVDISKNGRESPDPDPPAVHL
ncbi:trophoblast glycoprotein-like [Saccoglossus kowalevskii]|uniref:Trophoblast glycoprotein-like n=1 Tax=Saccoglossus kowalevskii TaxID=10224 RepID=A0ABM0MSI0_SACKO|nr:PREDICTED: trophoblast glycoprotein-like [Saccoglossus kowalevskii]